MHAPETIEPLPCSQVVGNTAKIDKWTTGRLSNNNIVLFPRGPQGNERGLRNSHHTRLMHGRPSKTGRVPSTDSRLLHGRALRARRGIGGSPGQVAAPFGNATVRPQD